MRSWPIQNKEDLDKTKGNLAEWVEVMFLETFLLISVALVDFLKSTIKVIIARVLKFVLVFMQQNNVF